MSSNTDDGPCYGRMMRFLENKCVLWLNKTDPNPDDISSSDGSFAFGTDSGFFVGVDLSEEDSEEGPAENFHPLSRTGECVSPRTTLFGLTATANEEVAPLTDVNAPKDK